MEEKSRLKGIELQEVLKVFINGPKIQLVAACWVKLGVPSGWLSDYMRSCDNIGIDDQDKNNDQLYQLAKESVTVTQEEKDAVQELLNILKEIQEFCKELNQNKGQAEDQIKVGITK